MRRQPEISYTSVRQDSGGVKMVVKLSDGSGSDTLVNTTVLPGGLSATVIVPSAIGIGMECLQNKETLL